MPLLLLLLLLELLLPYLSNSLKGRVTLVPSLLLAYIRSIYTKITY